MARVLGSLLFLLAGLAAAEPTRLSVNPARQRQALQGTGCGAIFYEGHVTSLAARKKDDRQQQLYDATCAPISCTS